MATQADFDRIGNYSQMYNHDEYINRDIQTRTVPMEVLALGYSRTGTLSMHKALTTLGYPCYHFSSILGNVRDADTWNRLFDAKYEGKGLPLTKSDFDGMLGHCGAVTDSPAQLFSTELIEFYPDAKVVLVEREIESWTKSWHIFLGNAFDPTIRWLGRLDPYWLGRITSVGSVALDKQVGGAQTLAAGKARSRDEYMKHYALVRSLVGEGRLLEFRLQDGWEPLCEFLGKPVPAEKFPHLNDSVANTQAFKEMILKGFKNIARNVAILATVGVISGYVVRRALRH